MKIKSIMLVLRIRERERERERERDHIKRFRGRLRALKLSTNALMDFIEQRSSFRTST